ncbi:MAG: DUF2730 domain-containing protein [Sphingopyxis sp.]|uniref:hypothetical protein n=1 Tax=Sphingopyxis sp. TaxID=1908224 RepID=UPI003D81239C
MDFDTFMRWAGAAALLLTIVNTGWIIAGRGAKPFTDRLDKHSKDLVDHDRRIQTLEGEAKHAPTGGQVTGLLLSVERLDGHVKRLEESMNGLTHTVRSMDNFLRSEKA